MALDWKPVVGMKCTNLVLASYNPGKVVKVELAPPNPKGRCDDVLIEWANGKRFWYSTDSDILVWEN